MSVQLPLNKDVAQIIGGYLNEQYFWLFTTNCKGEEPFIFKTYRDDEDDAKKTAHNLIMSGKIRVTIKQLDTHSLVYDTLNKHYAMWPDNEEVPSDRVTGPKMKDVKDIPEEMFGVLFDQKMFKIKRCHCLN